MSEISRVPLRWRVARALFDLLYRNRMLYWLASTIPFAGQWRRWQRLVLPHLASARNVLEVGCGIGTLLADLTAAGYTCSAVDASPQMVEATRGRLQRRGDAETAARVVQARVQALPAADASFDAVISTFPTDYIADPAALREIARVLRPGGRLIVVLGASLLPGNPLLLPFVAIQTLVYGRSRSGSSAAGDAEGAAVNRAFEALLRASGLEPRAESVRGPFWVAHLYVAEKPA